MFKKILKLFIVFLLFNEQICSMENDAGEPNSVYDSDDEGKDDTSNYEDARPNPNSSASTEPSSPANGPVNVSVSSVESDDEDEDADMSISHTTSEGSPRGGEDIYASPATTTSTLTTDRDESTPKFENEKQKGKEYAQNAGSAFLDKMKYQLLSRPYLTGLALFASFSGILYKYNSKVRKNIDSMGKNLKDKVNKIYLKYADKKITVSTVLKVGGISVGSYIGYRFLKSAGLVQAGKSMYDNFMETYTWKEKLIVGSSLVGIGVSIALIRNSLKDKNKDKKVKTDPV